MNKDSYIPKEIFHMVKLCNDITKTRLGAGDIRKVSYELYKHLDATNTLHKLPMHKERTHQMLCRNALVDNLVEEFDWQYWCVMTFGFNADKSVVDDVLEKMHYRFDRWIMTNNGESYLSVTERSKWVCLPERGAEGHIHYNIFIHLPKKPYIKTYGSEWKVVRYALDKSLSAIQKVRDIRGIDFRLTEKRRKKDALKTAVYSTKEMTDEWAKENNEDHFATFIRSWKDWSIRPLSKRSPLKIKPIEKASATLEQFQT